MADEADIASLFIDREVASAIEKLRQNAGQGPDEVEVKACRACGDDIEEERKKLGYKLCFSCAKESEQRRYLYADGN